MRTTRILSLTIIVLLSKITATGQTGPVSWPSFVGVEPAWEYKYTEPSVDSTDTYDRHVSITEPKIFDANNNLILFSSVVDSSNVTGSVFININPTDGTTNCQYASNHFTGAPEMEYYGQVELLEPDRIRLYGTERTNRDSIPPRGDWSVNTNQRAKFKIKEVDNLTCTLTDELVNLIDTLGFQTGGGARRYFFSPTTQPDRYLTYLPLIRFSARYRFAELDQNLTVDSLRQSDLFIFDNNPDSFRIENKILFRGQNYLITFVKQQNTQLHFEHPERSEVLKINFEDLDDIHVEQSLDITDISYDEFFGMPNPLQWHYHLDKENDNLLLNRAYLRSAGSTGWIVWMDKEGNLKANWETVSVDDHEYYFFQKIKITDDYCDLLAFPTSSGYEGYDVIRLNINGEVTKKGELVTEAGAPEFIASVSAQQIGDKVIVAGRPTPRFNLAVYGFDAKDLGIDQFVSTEDVDWLPKALQLTPYPNPTTDLLTVQLPTGVTIDRYQIVTFDAKMVLSEVVEQSGTMTLDVQQLPVGMYLLRCQTAEGQVYTAEFIRQ